MSAQRKHKNPFLVGSDFDMNSIRASHTTTTATSSATAHSSSSSFGNNVGDTATRLTEETLAVQSESAARMANAARIAQETQVTATKNLQQIHSQGGKYIAGGRESGEFGRHLNPLYCMYLNRTTPSH